MDHQGGEEVRTDILREVYRVGLRGGVGDALVPDENQQARRSQNQRAEPPRCNQRPQTV